MKTRRIVQRQTILCQVLQRLFIWTPNAFRVGVGIQEVIPNQIQVDCLTLRLAEFCEAVAGAATFHFARTHKRSNTQFESLYGFRGC